MSPTSIGGGANIVNMRELISPASCDAKLLHLYTVSCIMT